MTHDLHPLLPTQKSLNGGTPTIGHEAESGEKGSNATQEGARNAYPVPLAEPLSCVQTVLAVEHSLNSESKNMVWEFATNTMLSSTNASDFTSISASWHDTKEPDYSRNSPEPEI
jgi:hypothetical protein